MHEFGTPLSRALAADDRPQSWLARRLSERTGRQVGRNRVYEWVHGIRPKRETREAIADILGMEVTELWPEQETERRAA